jgi:hypothetical protein
MLLTGGAKYPPMPLSPEANMLRGTVLGVQKHGLQYTEPVNTLDVLELANSFESQAEQ